MRRRDFIAGIGTGIGGAAAWPLTGRAQPAERARRVGALIAFDENDPDAKLRVEGFAQTLAELGWVDGGNMRLDVRWAANVRDLQPLAKELVDLQPDVLISTSTAVTAAVAKEAKAIPIVFVNVSDPVGAGFVASVPRPGGNITGFIYQEASMAGKLVELLTEMAPGVERAGFMFNPETAPSVGTYYVPVFEAAAKSFKLAASITPVRSDGDIEKAISALSGKPAGGLIGAPDTFLQVHRAAILALTAQHKVPAVYCLPIMAADGGLLYYGPNLADQFRRAASYVDRILRGAKPAHLPVQRPFKFEMTVNLKTAKALGLAVPRSILALADKVVE
jgi:putative ABC transport system substrate-binding protein